ncbi:MAG TPA: thioredoxin family protein [Polyangia bacterium]|jgi:thiol-disulfide isomerase/thioredoxin|nr:thioredoxin family protein [Polyangia bacterium]
MRWKQAVTLALTLAATAVSCNPTSSGKSKTAAKAPANAHVEFVAAPEGDVAALVLRELDKAKHDGKRVLVYEGATWCEPCRRFHEAAAAGRLDAELSTLRLIEFDADRDNERLAVAGYVSRFIPMFALPKPDGNFSGRLIEGSVKGDGAVDEMVPRLRGLLAP